MDEKKEETALERLYDSQEFRKIGHELIDFISAYLESSYADQLVVNDYKVPDDALIEWKDFLDGKPSTLEYFKKVITDSIHLHNPNYMGHQVGVVAPIATFGGLVSDLLSNGMAVYEMGAVSNPLEFLCIQFINEKVGYDHNAGGFLTSGGTLANLTALLTARASKIDDDIWDKGYDKKQFAIMVSEQAHYCIDRAARIMGLGSEGIIKLPVDENFKVVTSSLEKEIQKAKDKGIIVFAVVSSSCSTSTGSYDDIASFATFAQKHDLWFHVDGAHGAATVFSDKYRHLVKGIEYADSVIIDCHKMMMTPTIATAVLYKNKTESNKTFRQKAEYLFDESESYDWYNSGKRTFECTKLMMSIKLMSIIQHSGEQIFGEYVTKMYDNAQTFAGLITQDPSFELAVFPEANILCFRYVGEDNSIDSLNKINSQIRSTILEEGKFYIVQTNLLGNIYLRTTIMNPKTEIKHFKALMTEIVAIAAKLI